jgi:hypothetical protein
MRVHPAFDFWIVREPLGLPFHQLSGLGFHRMGVAKSVNKNIPCFRCHSNSPLGSFAKCRSNADNGAAACPFPIQGERAQKTRSSEGLGEPGVDDPTPFAQSSVRGSDPGLVAPQASPRDNRMTRRTSWRSVIGKS